MTQLTIYLSAPNVTRPTPRYEQYYQLIAKQFPGATIIEACEEFAEYTPRGAWSRCFEDILKRVDLLIFLRNEQKYVGKGTLAEILAAHKAEKKVCMAVTVGKKDELRLIDWHELRFDIRNAKHLRNYARVRKSPEQM